EVAVQLHLSLGGAHQGQHGSSGQQLFLCKHSLLLALKKQEWVEDQLHSTPCKDNARSAWSGPIGRRPVHHLSTKKVRWTETDHSPFVPPRRFTQRPAVPEEKSGRRASCRPRPPFAKHIRCNHTTTMGFQCRMPPQNRTRREPKRSTRLVQGLTNPGPQWEGGGGKREAPFLSGQKKTPRRAFLALG